jgi:hypothetical protein
MRGNARACERQDDSSDCRLGRWDGAQQRKGLPFATEMYQAAIKKISAGLLHKILLMSILFQIIQFVNQGEFYLVLVA